MDILVDASKYLETSEETTTKRRRITKRFKDAKDVYLAVAQWLKHSLKLEDLKASLYKQFQDESYECFLDYEVRLRKDILIPEDNGTLVGPEELRTVTCDIVVPLRNNSHVLLYTSRRGFPEVDDYMKAVNKTFMFANCSGLSVSGCLFVPGNNWNPKMDIHIAYVDSFGDWPYNFFWKPNIFTSPKTQKAFQQAIKDQAVILRNMYQEKQFWYRDGLTLDQQNWLVGFGIHALLASRYCKQLSGFRGEYVADFHVLEAPKAYDLLSGTGELSDSGDDESSKDSNEECVKVEEK
jgi:hypothetical protein